MATPLFLVLLLVEFTDLVFAIDSIAAIFAHQPSVHRLHQQRDGHPGAAVDVLSAGRRVHKFVYLKFGLSLVLVFVGAKMMLIDVFKVPTTVSLAVIATVIGGSIALSLLRPPKDGVAPPPLGEPAPDAEPEVDPGAGSATATTA